MSYITFRKTLTDDIFNEMSEKYPTRSSLSGVELTQNITFCSFPSDEHFKIKLLLNKATSEKLNPYEVFTVFFTVVQEACAANGYYSEIDEIYYENISSLTYINITEVMRIIEFLVQKEYLYIFDNKITSVYNVRTFETVMSARAISRKSKYKQRHGED